MKIVKTLNWIFMGKIVNIPRKINLLISSRRKFSKSEEEIIKAIFLNKEGVRIGGKLSPYFESLANSTAKKVLDINGSKEYFNEENNFDYLADATSLGFIKSESFDFVASSHLLEHISNPIKALLEWKRIIKKGGIIYCAVPNKSFTFDNRRKLTSLSHLIEDYNSNVPPKDKTHIQEFLSKWDEDMDFTPREVLASKVIENPAINLHHHTFNKKNLKCLFEYVNLKIILIKGGSTIHIIGKK